MSTSEGNEEASSSAAAFSGRAGGPLNPPSTLVGVAKLVKGVQPELGPDFARVSVAVDDGGGLPGGGVLRVKLADADDRGRWEVPPSLLDESAGGGGGGTGGGRDEDDDDDDDGKTSSSSSSPPMLRASVDRNLNIKVTRTSSSSSSSSSSNNNNSLPLFDTSGLRLVLKDQYLELSTRVAPDSALFGLGERISSTGLALRRSGRPLALWNRDCTDYPDLNLYGSFPFVLELRRDGTAHGLLLWNSNAMDAVLTTDSRLSFRTTGGVADLYVLAGPTPAAVVEQLTRLVGRPAMPPLWALGFHQSKYGYKDVRELEGVSEGYTRAKIPLDAGKEERKREKEFFFFFFFEAGEVGREGEREKERNEKKHSLFSFSFSSRFYFFPKKLFQIHTQSGATSTTWTGEQWKRERDVFLFFFLFFFALTFSSYFSLSLSSLPFQKKKKKKKLLDGRTSPSTRSTTRKRPSEPSSTPSTARDAASCPSSTPGSSSSPGTPLTTTPSPRTSSSKTSRGTFTSARSGQGPAIFPISSTRRRWTGGPSTSGSFGKRCPLTGCGST